MELQEYFYMTILEFLMSLPYKILIALLKIVAFIMISIHMKL